jgi:hypothetical protein
VSEETATQQVRVFPLTQTAYAKTVSAYSQTITAIANAQTVGPTVVSQIADELLTEEAQKERQQTETAIALLPTHTPTHTPTSTPTPTAPPTNTPTPTPTPTKQFVFAPNMFPLFVPNANEVKSIFGTTPFVVYALDVSDLSKVYSPQALPGVEAFKPVMDYNAWVAPQGACQVNVPCVVTFQSVMLILPNPQEALGVANFLNKLPDDLQDKEFVPIPDPNRIWQDATCVQGFYTKTNPPRTIFNCHEVAGNAFFAQSASELFGTKSEELRVQIAILEFIDAAAKKIKEQSK